MTNYLVFDIETRVDKDLVKQIYDPENSLTLDQAYDTARDQNSGTKRAAERLLPGTISYSDLNIHAAGRREVPDKIAELYWSRPVLGGGTGRKVLGIF